MSENLEFYDVHEQTKYGVVISRPTKVEELSDLFITTEELHDLVGRNIHGPRTGVKQSICFNAVVQTEVQKWIDKLVDSGKKTLRIEDEELLEVLKRGYLSDYTNDCTKYGRHGDRICFAQQFKRIKRKATQSDVNKMWNHLSYGFRDKFGIHPTHIPKCNRHLQMFKAFQKIVGWRRVRAHITDKTTVKFFRQIWDNPKEFIR